MLTFNNVRGTVEGGKKIKDINIQQCTGIKRSFVQNFMLVSPFA
jgi:hypothetical protein